MVMYGDVSLVRHQHLSYVAPYTFSKSCDVPKIYRLKMMHLHAIISQNSSLMQGVSANNHRRFDLP